jgi:hypothetical protein
MKRYVVGKFDDSTFVVIDEVERREVCVCSNYDDWEDAEERANKIVKLLNASISE